MYKLIIADDEGKTTVVPLVRDEITIGRKEGNTIRLTERNVSRRHARLLRNNNGFVVEDLESYNGVRLNGVPVISPRPLNDGDQLSIGDYQLSFRSDRPAAAAPPPPVPVAPPPYPRLVMLGPPEPGREFALTEPELVIGRTDENAIVINHRSISRSHAKIATSDGLCRLFDLDSANGVRVNGEDYDEVELRRGDLVELGTVRLRFVGAGEHYQFDADATVQMDALPEDLGPRRSPVLAILLGVVLVCALGVGAYFVFAWQPTDGGAGARPTPVRPPTPPPAAGPSLADVKAKARELIDRELYEPALSILRAKLPTDDEELRRLISKAVSEQEALGTWESACGEDAPVDAEAVYEICQRIDGESRYKTKTCCGEAADLFGRSRLDAARRHERAREWSEMLDAAVAVVDNHDVSDGLRDQATALAARAQKRLETAAAPPSVPGPGGGKTPGKGVRPPTPPTPPTPTKRTPADEALAEARGCVLRNDQGCCIRALQGAERTAAVVRLHVSCLDRAGQHDAACRLAKRYKRVSALRQFVEASCQ